jgi:hypothetical protein
MRPWPNCSSHADFVPLSPLITRIGDSLLLKVPLDESDPVRLLKVGPMDRIDAQDESQLVHFDDGRIKQWIGYGFLMLAIYLERHAAFEEYCRTHRRP